MILVTAASGMFGSGIVRGLAAQGVPARAVARNVDKLQASFADAGDLSSIEFAAADMDDPSTLDAVMADVDRIFLNAPMDEQKEARESAVLDAAVRAGTNPQIVLLTGGVQHNDSLGAQGAAVEAKMKASGLPWTIVGPQTVLETNLLTQQDAIRYGNTIVACVGDAKIGFVEVQDCIDAFVTVLTAPVDAHNAKTYIITGPQTYTFSDIAAIGSEVLGRTITYTDMAPDDYRTMLLNVGAFTEDTIEDGVMCHMTAMRNGQAETITDDFTTLTGNASRTPAYFFETYRAELTPPPAD